MKTLLVFFFITITFLANGQSTEKVINPVVTVSNLDKVLPFYTKTLPFELLGIREVSHNTLAKVFNIANPETTARIATLKLGEEKFELMDFIEPENGKKIPEDSRSNDLWFQHIAIVVSDMDLAYKMLSNRDVEQVSTMPETLPNYITAAAGIKAFYFHDPDGHNLEIIYFPAGKGNPKWQKTNGKVFLGIDHTAIASNITTASLKFYQNFLGLKVAGSSENYGPEQEHLNQVFGAHLKITGLIATQPNIGIELLDYISPLSGRVYPQMARANDLIHWHTVLKVKDLAALYEKAINEGYTIISQGIVSVEGLGIPSNKGLMIRDADGHAVLLYE
jgi:catechol 2,3-dioxygenase-like lactoylglutathione lyase family enzyme